MITTVDSRAFIRSCIAGFCVLLGILTSISSFANDDIEARIDSLLDQLTLEQKVGQMTQVTLGIMIDKSVKDGIVFDRKVLEEAVNRYQVGSILNTSSRPLTVAQWHDLFRSVT